MNKRQAIPFVLLFITFLIWLYLKPELLNTAEEETRPTFIAHKIENNHFNEDGFLDIKFAATQMIDIEKNKHIKFNDPKIDIFIKDKATDKISLWRITSLDGKLFDSNKLILTNDVLIENLTKDQLVQKLTTIEMTFLLNEKELYSDKLVNLEGPQMTQEGVGMWGSLNTEELIFKNKIKAVYLNEKK